MPDPHDLFGRAADGIPPFDADAVRHTVARRRRRRRLMVSTAVAFVLAVSGTAIGVAARHRSPQVSIAPQPSTSTSSGATTPSTATTGPGAPLVYPRVTTHPESFRGFGKLAYPAGGKLWILDGASSSPRSIALPGAVERMRWSHDGAWLALQTEAGSSGPGPLFVVGSDGATLVPVPASVSTNDWDWSPTRDVLAVVDQAPSARTGAITSFAAPDFTRAVSTPIAAEYPAGFLLWSPDGRHLIYKTYDAQTPPDVDQLWSVDETACPPACSPAPRQVSVGVRSSYQGDVGYLAAGWSADGSRLLIWLDDAHSGSIELDGLALASIAPSAGSGVKLPVMLAKPSWIATVPNTNNAVVAVGGVRDWDARRQLDACDLDTGACTPLVANAGPVIDPAVSPNGQRLAYVATDPVVFANNAELPPKSSIQWNKSRRLVVAGIANQNPAVIAAGGVVSPRWAADDRHLIFWRAGYLWLIDADHPAPVAIAGQLAPRPDDFGFGAFEQSPYILPGDDVWNVVAWLP